jgi:hypothetical protein
MYDISPNWRGTHNGNYAFQDGEVVLYDVTKVPLLDL